MKDVWTTPIGQVAVCAASVDDLETILNILGETSDWLGSSGVHEMPNSLPDEINHQVEEEISRGRVFLARAKLDNSTVGVMQIDWMDMLYWPMDPIGAGYINNFAITKSFQGNSIGKAMIEWAKEFVREQGRCFIRLNCLASNLPLRQYYERLGFIFRGEVFDRNYTAALYEMAL
jgi:ribosomal protein S18 acetylase RimI-like enzyme